MKTIKETREVLDKLEEDLMTVIDKFDAENEDIRDTTVIEICDVSESLCGGKTCLIHRIVNVNTTI